MKEVYWVSRGGAWYDYPQFVRVTDRYGYTPDTSPRLDLGLRVARSSVQRMAP